MLKVAVGCDHAGFSLVGMVNKYLQANSYQVINHGTDNGEDSVDYPIFAQKVAKSVANNEADFGILLCGTGIGMGIAANKIKGVRAACISEPYSARMARAHNNANVLCIGSRTVGSGLAKEILDSFLNTLFEGDRHLKRVDMYE